MNPDFNDRRCRPPVSQAFAATQEPKVASLILAKVRDPDTFAATTIKMEGQAAERLFAILLEKVGPTNVLEVRGEF
jgi:hypothetical protein